MAQFSNGLLGFLACFLKGAIWVSLRPLIFSERPFLLVRDPPPSIRLLVLILIPLSPVLTAPGSLQ